MTFSFRSNQIVNSTTERGFGQNLGGFLETGGGNEAFALNGRLGNPQQLWSRLRRSWLGVLRRAEYLSINFFNFGNRNRIVNLVFRVSGIGDAALGLQFFVDPLQLELVNQHARQQIRITNGGDLHLSKHLSDHDFNVLVVDFYSLSTIDVLNFVQQVLLHFFRTADSKNVFRNQWPTNKSIAGDNKSPV